MGRHRKMLLRTAASGANFHPMKAKTEIQWTLVHKKSHSFKAHWPAYKGKKIVTLFATRAEARARLQAGGLYTIFRVARVIVQECEPDTRITPESRRAFTNAGRHIKHAITQTITIKPGKQTGKQWRAKLRRRARLVSRRNPFYG